MVWVFGNAHERIPIKDLNDVIYFRQKKQYTDQEFEKSRDLQREIQLGRIIKLEQKPEIKSSLPETVAEAPAPANHQPSPSINMAELKKIVVDAVSANKNENTDIKSLVTNLVPIIAETVRQEVSKIQIQTVSGPVQGQQESLRSEEPGYVPEVKLEGLKSNISIEGKAVEGSGIANSLELLKKMSVKST